MYIIPKIKHYARVFLKKVEWDPTIQDVFAGKLDYPKLDFLNKLSLE